MTLRLVEERRFTDGDDRGGNLSLSKGQPPQTFTDASHQRGPCCFDVRPGSDHGLANVVLITVNNGRNDVAGPMGLARGLQLQ